MLYKEFYYAVLLSSEVASHVPLRQYRHSSRSFVLLLRFHSVSTPVGKCIIRSFELFSSRFFFFSYSFTALIYYTSRRAPQLRRGASDAYDAWPWQASQSTFTNSGSVPPKLPTYLSSLIFFWRERVLFPAVRVADEGLHPRFDMPKERSDGMNCNIKNHR